VTKKVFIHVGMPKCASSTIQDVLWQGRQELADAGVQYGLFSEEDTYLQGNGAKLAHAIRVRNTDAMDRRIDYFMGLDGKVLISAEAFSNVSNGGETRRMFQEMRAQGAEVKVICYFRRQDLWVESDYKQHIKGRSSWTAPIKDLIQKRHAREVLNYARTMAYWAMFAGKGNAIAVILNPGQPKDYPVRRLLDFLGIASGTLDGVMSRQDINVSPPTGLIEPARLLKFALMQKGLPQEEVSETLGIFFDQAPRQIKVPARRFLLPHAERTALVKDFHDRNMQLPRDYSAQSGFDDEVIDDLASEMPLLPEAEAIFKKYVRHVPALSRPRRWFPLLRGRA